MEIVNEGHQLNPEYLELFSSSYQGDASQIMLYKLGTNREFHAIIPTLHLYTLFSHYCQLAAYFCGIAAGAETNTPSFALPPSGAIIFHGMVSTSISWRAIY